MNALQHLYTRPKQLKPYLQFRIATMLAGPGQDLRSPSEREVHILQPKMRQPLKPTSGYACKKHWDEPKLGLLST